MNVSAQEDGGALAPRDFCGRVPWRLIAELTDGEEVVACYLVHQVRRLLTKAGQPYLKVLLGDRTGTIDAVIWDDVDRWEPVCVPSRVIGVRGQVSMYQGRPQLRVLSVAPVEADATEMRFLVPAAPRDFDLMERELDAQIASVSDRGLRGLLRRCLGRDTEIGKRFRRHAAATRNHHAYLHGLLEHTLSVASACDRLAEHYREQGIQIDRDLLITGALLHDVGKVEELEAPPAVSYTTSGRLLGHIVIGIGIVERESSAVRGLDAERVLLVQHLIASHQGKPEWDSPRVPQMLEAFILHYADDLDAKMNQAMSALADVAPGEWSEYDRSLARSLYRTPRSGSVAPGSADADDALIDLFAD